MIRAQQELAARLGGQLPAEWQVPYAANPRHAFLPDLVWHDVGEPIDRRTDPDRWLSYAYSDESVITQLHDGAASSDHGYPISSSCSAPAVVFAMLRHLDAQPGHRVLEIGTGTGWTASLLGSRLGDDQVVTVEVDPAVASTARANLERAGRRPMVITGDGTDGYLPGAPYDRIVATASVETVPAAWLRQARTGAVILTPWGPTFDNSALLRLTVADDGGSASGRFVDWAAFMRVRSQRPAIPDEPADFDEIARRTPLDDVDIAEMFSDGARMGVGLHVPDTRVWIDGGGGVVWLLAPGAWAVATGGEVRQAGGRSLWEEAVAGYRWWIEAGRPGRHRYGVTVTAGGQTVWLDEPDRTIIASTY